MAGTLKNGAHTSVTTRHTLIFSTPAGIRKTLTTVRDVSGSANVGQEDMHGDGAVGAYAIAKGEGSCEWGFALAEHEYQSVIVNTAKAAGITISDLVFNWLRESLVNGLPKSSIEYEGCQIGDDEDKTDAAGNMMTLKGKAANRKRNGVQQYRSP